MEPYWHEKVLSLCQFVLYFHLLISGGRTGLARRFPIFYGFVLWRAGLDAGGWIVILRSGVGSWVFVEYYSFGLFGDRLFMLALAVEMLRLVEFARLGLARATVGGIVVGLLGPTLLSSPRGFVHQSFIGGLAQTGILLIVIAAARCGSRSGMVLGANHLGLMGGLLLKSCLDYGLVVSLRFDWSAYQELRPWIQPASLLPWAWWTWAMRRGAPSRVLSQASVSRVDRLSPEVASAVRRRIRLGSQERLARPVRCRSEEHDS